jgi:cell division protein FtsL
MSIIKTPGSKRKPKQNRRVLSGGAVAERKWMTFLDRGLGAGRGSAADSAMGAGGARGRDAAGMATRSAGKSGNVASASGARGGHHSTRKDAATRNARTSTRNKKQGLKAWKVIAWSLGVGLAGFLYISHQYQTQQTLLEVRGLEKSYRQSLLQVQDLQMQLDRVTGPKEIYQKAREQGFVNAGTDHRVLKVEGE